MATLEEQVHRFDGIQRVVANDEKFKARLGAGADTFTSLRVADLLNNAWGVGGAASSGAGIAASYLAPTGIAALLPTSIASSLGLLTPVGWVVGAAAAAGGLYFGVNRLFRSYYGSRVEEIPRFLNSSIDVLGASFLDLVGSLAIKVAAIDDGVHDQERAVIREYFTDEWGFDPEYVHRALDLLEEKVDEQRISEMAGLLAEFARTNPDCDFAKIRAGLRELLTEISEADGSIDEREEMAIERIVGALDQEISTYRSVKRTIEAPVQGVRSAAGWASGKLRRG
jgi:uncharacterized tellurite resistance protein B-like protein